MRRVCSSTGKRGNQPERPNDRACGEPASGFRNGPGGDLGELAIRTGFSWGRLERGVLGCESTLNEGLPHPWDPWGWLCFWKREVMP